MTNDVEHLFICSFAICISDEVTVTVFCPLFFLFLFLINSFLALLDFHCFVRAFSSWAEWLVCAWASCCGGFFCLGPWALGLRASVVVAHHLIGIVILLLSSVQYFGWQSFTRYVFCKRFRPVCGLSSRSLDHIAEQTFLLFKSSWWIDSFRVHAFDFSEKSLPNPRSSRFSPVLSSRIFIVLCFTRPVIWKGVRFVSRFLFLFCLWIPSCSNTICWSLLFSSLVVFCSFVKDKHGGVVKYCYVK